MIQTALWIPPSLCGCRINMTADFLDESVINGISYRHPIPYSIKKLSIEKVCATHKPYSLKLIDTSIFFDIDSFTNQLKQNRGYLTYPIENPTDAECLYTFLSQLGGQTHRLNCGCSAHQFKDENNSLTYLHHPRHTKKCHKHLNDTHDMKQALIDHQAS